MCHSEKGMTMTKLRDIARAALAGAIALLLTTVLCVAQDVQRTWSQTPAHRGIPTWQVVAKPAMSAHAAQPKKPPAVVLAAKAPADKVEHHLILQVNSSDPAAMNLALNNAMNVTQYYKQMGEDVKIEVVTFGPGLNMLRDDT